MPVRQDRRRKPWRWFFRKVVVLPDGRRVTIRGTPQINTKVAAEAAEREAIERVLRGEEPRAARKEEAPTLEKWFYGRFWTGHVLGSRRPSSPGEQANKRSVFEHHIGPRFGSTRIDRIGAAEVDEFRAALKASGTLTDKSINNVLAVLSTALRYARRCRVIDDVPDVGAYNVEAPEISFWDWDEYARLLHAAEEEGPTWYVAACLAGECGLRVGEVKGLRWREDVDLVAGTVTVNQQIRHGRVGPPKGRRRRTIPMTPTLVDALKRLEVVRTGYVVRNWDGEPMTDRQANRAMHRIVARAGLPPCERAWHRLRHTYGTHCALLGVNPWVLQGWLGHKSITTTERYVHVARDHARPIPPAVLAAGNLAGNLRQPQNGQVAGQLGARRCRAVAAGSDENAETAENS